MPSLPKGSKNLREVVAIEEEQDNHDDAWELEFLRQAQRD
jgi:hypothetical protein